MWNLSLLDSLKKLTNFQHNALLTVANCVRSDIVPVATHILVVMIQLLVSTELASSILM